MQEDDGFDEIMETAESAPTLGGFVVDIDGYEGPIDVLLMLAREQKVDLAHISILQLANQYLAFVAEARRTNLELAADYLVMAAWLAYLKSRLLLPVEGDAEQPSGEEMAAALQFQLRRLESMQEAGARLMSRPQLGQHFFGRGETERFAPVTKIVFDVSLFDLLKAYGEQKQRNKESTLHIQPWTLFSVDESLERLRSLIGKTPDWEVLWRFLPAEIKGSFAARSAVASTFAASLEMCKSGQITLRQEDTFGPIYLRAVENYKEAKETGGAGDTLSEVPSPENDNL